MLPFQRNDILNIRDIEQGLENLQRVPDVDVKINIEPGTRDGYSIVHIDTHRGKTGAFGQVTTIGAMKKRAVTRQPRWVICLIQRKWGICFISPVRVVLPDSMKTSVVIIPFLWGTGSTAFL